MTSTTSTPPQWIAHRGIHLHALENTLPAFTAAVLAGFHILETDLQVTADDHIVLAHDPNLARLGGPVRAIASMTASQVALVRLTAGHQILFFDEFIRRFAGQGWIFDIKPHTALRTIAALDAWASRNQSREWLIAQAYFLFWNAGHQRAFEKLFPRARCLARRWECYAAGLAALTGLALGAAIEHGRIYALPPTLAGISLYQQRIVRAYHDHGAKVLAFLPRAQALSTSATMQMFDYILVDNIFPLAPVVP